MYDGQYQRPISRRQHDGRPLPVAQPLGFLDFCIHQAAGFTHSAWPPCRFSIFSMSLICPSRSSPISRTWEDKPPVQAMTRCQQSIDRRGRRLDCRDQAAESKGSSFHVKSLHSHTSTQVCRDRSSQYGHDHSPTALKHTTTNQRPAQNASSSYSSVIFSLPAPPYLMRRTQHSCCISDFDAYPPESIISRHLANLQTLCRTRGGESRVGLGTQTPFCRPACFLPRCQCVGVQDRSTWEVPA
ncbi:hypothetical protein QBC39DRAFT_160878 [Podospora conica]|nr:hypothetical protein QBC39DRAFT_160878 [Schizothecium conicum]